MGRHGTLVGAVVVTLVVLVVWWLTAGAAGRSSQRGAEAALAERTAGAADLVVERGGLDEPGGRQVAEVLDLLAPSDGAAVLWDDTGRILAASGEPAPSAPPDDALGERVASGQVDVVREGEVLRALASVARVDGRPVVLELTSSAEGLGPAAARDASTWIAVVGAVLAAAVVLGAGRARDRLLRSRVEGQQAAVRRADALLTEHRDLDRAKDAFLSAVSHAVRTPLQVIEGTTSLLANRVDDLSRDQLLRLTDGMVVSTRRLTELLRDVIDLDRLVRGLGSSWRRSVDVRELVDEVLAHHGVDRERVRVEVDAEEALVDPGQLGRILDHLLHNALRHSPPDGVVTVRAERDEHGLHLVVLDEGPGIPEHLRLRVFEPLFRIDHGDADPGVGVGLALVRRFAMLHGGRAWVDDAPDGGAALHVALPDEGDNVGVDAWGVAAALG